MPFSEKIKNLSSFVFLRSSIPFFWGHSNIGISAKPDIFINKEIDPLFECTEKHFNNITKRYGDNILIYNLIKKDHNSKEYP